MKYQKIFNLKNKVSIVTGATGMLGKEFALGLSQSGSKVAIVDLDRTKARKLAQSITKKYGPGTLDPNTGVFTPSES